MQDFDYIFPSGLLSRGSWAAMQAIQLIFVMTKRRINRIIEPAIKPSLTGFTCLCVPRVIRKPWRRRPSPTRTTIKSEKIVARRPKIPSRFSLFPGSLPDNFEHQDCSRRCHIKRFGLAGHRDADLRCCQFPCRLACPIRFAAYDQRQRAAEVRCPA